VFYINVGGTAGQFLSLISGAFFVFIAEDIMFLLDKRWQFILKFRIEH